MDSVFHEKQEGSLCAQHCLNSLLQGPYFTAVELSTLAQKLDDEERQRMAESGENSEDYLKFLRQPSGNMDDSGYFSVQVISSALQVWGLELVPYTSADERIKNCTDPSQMKAFICNYKDHWFTIRKIGNQWINLNSLLSKPIQISDTYLALFLAQLKNEGYSIFVVFGDLPECTADKALLEAEKQKQQQQQQQQQQKQKPIYQNSISIDSNDIDLQAALQLSLQSANNIVNNETLSIDSDDQELQEALRLSLIDNTPEEAEHDDDDDEALLKKAIDMSLQC